MKKNAFVLSCLACLLLSGCDFHSPASVSSTGPRPAESEAVSQSVSSGDAFSLATLTQEDRSAITAQFRILLDDFRTGVYPYIGKYGVGDLSINGFPADSRIPDTVSEADLELSYKEERDNYPYPHMVRAALPLENDYTLTAQFYTDAEQDSSWNAYAPAFLDLRGSRQRDGENALLVYDRLTQTLSLTGCELDSLPTPVTGTVSWYPAGNLLRVELQTTDECYTGFHWNRSEDSIDGSSEVESLNTTASLRTAARECMAFLTELRDSALAIS